jgi:hypothetical protein
MAQICADLGSKPVDVFEMPRRTHVPAQIDRFCARWWSPLVLLSDGAAECMGVAIQAVCARRDIHQIFRTPGQTKVAVQNFAEAAIGYVTRMATFALVFSGATIRYWFLALEAACFVDRLSAHWYEYIPAYSTPYYRIYGQHFPDAGVLKPWGCAALVLLPGDLLSKFKPRTVKMVFVSYAPQYPTYTYGFLNCTTGRVPHSQDAIFLHTEFPFRDARRRMNCSNTDGDPLQPRVLSRSPYAYLAPSNLRFNWEGGPTVPDHDEDASLVSPDFLASMDVLPNGVTGLTVSPAPFPPTVALIKSIDDDAMELLHDFLLGKQFRHPESHFGVVTISGWGRHQRVPVTFYVSVDLQENYSSTWEVFDWLHAYDPQPSVREILEENIPKAPPAAPLPKTISSLLDRRPIRTCRTKVGAFKCVVKELPPLTRKRHRKLLLGMYGSFDGTTAPPRTWEVPHLCPQTTRAIFKAKQTIFQGGVRIPTNDTEADQSPEWRQWGAGRSLEHVRLDNVKAFRKGFSLAQVTDAGYPKSGIVLLQHVYAFKHSGEFRVRCVARGDTQHPIIHSDAYFCSDCKYAFHQIIFRNRHRGDTHSHQR